MNANSPCYELSETPADTKSTPDDQLAVLLSPGRALPLRAVGGKAQNLIRLIEAGVRVPGGFCLTTAAYRAFLERNDLSQQIHECVEHLQGADKDVRSLVSQRIRSALLSGTFPEAITAAISRSYTELSEESDKDCCVAVRSSAVAEDLAEASFAGAHATILNVHGLPALLDAVRICWASLWTEQVGIYRSRMRISAELEMAVIVQRMVRARCSGVLFTIDPLSGDHNRIVLEACWGLGESLVSGKTLPDRFELDRNTLRVVAQTYAGQRESVECGEQGIRTVTLEEARRREPCLNTVQLRSLARIALQIEARFGAPQDIEWAVDANDGQVSSAGQPGIYILQSRPITVFNNGKRETAPSAEAWETQVPGAIWVRQSGGMVEHLPGPASTLFATAQLPLICEYLDAQCPEMGVITPDPTYALINGYYFNRSDYQIGFKSLLLPLNYWKAARKGSRHWREQVLPEQELALRAFSEFDLATASAPQLLEHVTQLLSFNAKAWDNAVRASRTYVFTEPLLLRIFKHFIHHIVGGDALTLLCGFDSQIMAGEHAQWKLAHSPIARPLVERYIRDYPPQEAWERILSDPACMPWAQELNEYQQTYGHSNATLDYLHPSIADDPTQAIRSIRVRMDTETEDPFERKHKLALERQIATARILQMLDGRPLRKALFRWILEWAQEGASTREDIFFQALRGWPLARRTFLQLGRKLVDTGAISLSEDVFFIEWAELKESVLHCPPAGLQTRIDERKARHRLRETLIPPACVPDEVVVSTHKKTLSWLKRSLLGGAKVKQDGILWGAAVSPGLATGPARIIFSAEDLNRLRPGDILVTRAATPEWTPAFCIASGLVTDIGGPLSHSSIIAREFGLPAVMGVRVATTTISEGQLITVDGAAGSVWLQEGKKS